MAETTTTQGKPGLVKGLAQSFFLKDIPYPWFKTREEQQVQASVRSNQLLQSILDHQSATEVPEEKLFHENQKANLLLAGIGKGLFEINEAIEIARSENFYKRLKLKKALV